MKKLYDYIAEGILDVDLEEQIDTIATKDYIDQHFKELFKPMYSKNAHWTPKGIDCSEAYAKWVEIVELWKKGIKVPIAKVGSFSNSGFYDYFNAVPKDPKDFDILVNEVLAKTKIDLIMVNTEKDIDSNFVKLLQHPNIDKISIDFKNLDKSLSKIPFNKIKAKKIQLSDFDSYKSDRKAPTTPVFNYKAISGWKGLRLQVEWSFGLVDVSDWRNGASRTLKFNDENKEALDHLFSKNNFKDIMLNCMSVYNGSNRECSGKPYYAYITKSGSEYTYKLK